MSRQIKFRAWNRLTEQMVTDQPVMIDTDGSIEVGGYSTIDDEGGSIVVMQYTGLTDKNGVEIYEDDILQDTHNDPYGGAHVMLDAVIFNSDPAGFTFGDRWSPLNTVDLKRMEVIGNIYENPELLG